MVFNYEVGKMITRADRTTKADQPKTMVDFSLQQPASESCISAFGPLEANHHALKTMADQSPRMTQLKVYQTMADKAVVQRQVNNTGLPDNLKSGIENLSGYSMNDVKVHYNSDKPAQLNAHAYAQGTTIHLASGQEKHLPHEAWHVVQQKQGRVQPTRQLKGKVAINDDAGLEREADVMGEKALQFKRETTEQTSSFTMNALSIDSGLVQRQALVIVEEKSPERVVISAVGEAIDFSGGKDAKNNGWNGVKKYKAAAKVGDTLISLGMTNNNFIVGQAGHVLAQQNGGDGGDPENVFAQDGGVNNGPYRSNFENPMREALKKANPDDDVQFRAVLYGSDIKQGKLTKLSDQLDASDEESDFEGF
jgi:hypothetical protein